MTDEQQLATLVAQVTELRDRFVAVVARLERIERERDALEATLIESVDAFFDVLNATVGPDRTLAITDEYTKLLQMRVGRSKTPEKQAESR